MTRFLEHCEENISLKKSTIMEFPDILNYIIAVFMVLHVYSLLFY